MQAFISRSPLDKHLLSGFLHISHAFTTLAGGTMVKEYFFLLLTTPF